MQGKQGNQELQEFQEADKDEGGGDERNPEMKFLDTNLTKDLSLWLHATYIHSPFLLEDFPENHTLLSVLKFIQKIRETRKLEPIYEQHFAKQKNQERKPEKIRV